MVTVSDGPGKVKWKKATVKCLTARQLVQRGILNYQTGIKIFQEKNDICFATLMSFLEISLHESIQSDCTRWRFNHVGDFVVLSKRERFIVLSIH